MNDLDSLGDYLSKKHLQKIIPNLHTRNNSPTVYFKLQDESVIEFEFRTGEQTPRAYGKSNENMAREMVADLKCIETTIQTCSFIFNNDTKFEIDFNQFDTTWTKFPRNIGRIPQIIVATEELWFSYAIFNGNAFPSNLLNIVEGCTQKSAMLFAHIRTINFAYESEKSKFVDLVNGKSGKSPIEGFSGNSVQIEFESVLLTTSVHGFLVTFKAFLDNYAFLLARLIGIKSSVDFGKAKVNGKKISGGSIINALRNNCPKGYTTGEVLASAIESHSNNWISNIISLRDQATHQSSIISYDKICMLATKNQNTNLFDLNFLPITIKDVELYEFFNEALINLKKFLIETLKYAPEIREDEMNSEDYGGPFIHQEESC